MFIQDHHIGMLVYYENVRQLKQDHPQGWERFSESLKKGYLLRVAATIDAFKGAIIGFSIQTLKALNECVIGVIHFDRASFLNAGHYALGALIDLIALPIIGIIGIAMPSLAITITAQISEKAREIINRQTESQLQTVSFSEVTGRLICPLRGATEAVADILQALSFAITKLVNAPLTSNFDCIHGVFLPLFKGQGNSTDVVTREDTCLAAGCVKILAGGTGVFFSESRNYLNIYP